MFKNLFLHNWFAILYFNFKMLPFKKAIFIPFDFYGSVRFISLKGKVCLDTNRIRPGMIKLGSQGRDMFPLNPVVLDIRGILRFKGSFKLGCGSTIRVEPNAELCMGVNSRVGANCLVFCEDKIQIGDNVGMSWYSQIMDTDTHSVINVKTTEIGKRKSPVVIGANTWIGNHVIINKGCVLPRGTIVASMSLCNKNYMELIPDYSLIGGVPAKLLKTDVKRGDDKL